MKVKICGITNKEDAILAEKLGADAIGFIFYKGSKRYISPESASEIIKILSPLTLKVGVFVNDEPDFINKTASKVKLNTVQLHGDEKSGIINKINFPVIKSFRINGEFDFNILTEFNGASFLFDSYSKEKYGGTGKTFNWDLIPQELNENYILSGGVSSDNIEEILNRLNPKAVDVSSSLETSPGIKNHKKLREFFHKINSVRS